MGRGGKNRQADMLDTNVHTVIQFISLQINAGRVGRGYHLESAATPDLLGFLRPKDPNGAPPQTLDVRY
ncbi:MAG: hypothetical protein ACRELG_12710, partial [Gemmataceae bacterium]